MIDVDLRGAAALEADARGGVRVVESAGGDAAVVQQRLTRESAGEHPVAGVAAVAVEPAVAELLTRVAGLGGAALDGQRDQRGRGAIGGPRPLLGPALAGPAGLRLLDLAAVGLGELRRVAFGFA